MTSDHTHDSFRKAICIPVKVNCSVARKTYTHSTEHLLCDFTICLLDTYYRTLTGQIIIGPGKENQKCDNEKWFKYSHKPKTPGEFK
jgi:hypothetical protein